MRGWTFCIVTGPGSDENLIKVVNSIALEFQDRDDYEVIIVGTVGFDISQIHRNVTLISFAERVFAPSIRGLKTAIKHKKFNEILYRTGAICRKKNIAAENARFDKLCILHDYVALTSGWLEGWERFGDEWQVAMNILQNQDGKRHRDWLNLDYPGIRNNAKVWETSCLQAYDVTTNYMYIPGQYFCVKREFFLKHLLNENLFWGEGEDIEWSLRVRKVTKFYMNKNSICRYVKQKPVDWQTWDENEKKLKRLLNY